MLYFVSILAFAIVCNIFYFMRTTHSPWVISNHVYSIYYFEFSSYFDLALTSQCILHNKKVKTINALKLFAFENFKMEVLRVLFLLCAIHSILAANACKCAEHLIFVISFSKSINLIESILNICK